MSRHCGIRRKVRTQKGGQHRVHNGFEGCFVFLLTEQARRIRAPRRAMLACSGVAKPAPPLGSASNCRSQVPNPNCG